MNDKNSLFKGIKGFTKKSEDETHASDVDKNAGDIISGVTRGLEDSPDETVNIAQEESTGQISEDEKISDSKPEQPQSSPTEPAGSSAQDLGSLIKELKRQSEEESAIEATLDIENPEDKPQSSNTAETPAPPGSLSDMIQKIRESENVQERDGINDGKVSSVISEVLTTYEEAEAPSIHTASGGPVTKVTRITDEESDEQGGEVIVHTDAMDGPSPGKTHWSTTADSAGKTPGVVSIDELSGLSSLILAKGAELDLEEFHISEKDRQFDLVDRKQILSALDGLVQGDVDNLDLSKMTPPETPASPVKEEKKRKFGGKIFGKIIGEVEEYDPSIHGPVVDLTMNENDAVEEIELYPVNEPFAYIRIIFDHNAHEYQYRVIEPVLTEAERVLRDEIVQRLFETLDVNTQDLTKDKANEALKSAVDEIIFDYGIKLDPPSRAKVYYNIQKTFLGDGVIDAVMHDKYIEDISCDGLKSPIFVFHSNYESIQTNLSYDNTAELDSFVTKLAQRAGKYISISEPMLDATMADGSRIQMTLGREVTAHGSTFTIRKFKEEPITPTDLIEWGTYSPLSVAFFWLAVENGKSCIFAGGTASGKTTSLNAISLFIPPLAKIVTLEDTRELKLPHKNWIPSITRESFDSSGKGSIDMYELLRAALRQRPEYILVGEVRGKESQTLFQAMSTGHVTYATVHADSVASVVHRFENPPMNVPRNMLSALDLVSVQVQARFGGQRIRRNKALIEILDIDPRTKELITNEVFKWNAATDEIRYSGKSYVLEDIMETKGWSEARMREELKRRQEILEWMRIKKIRHYEEVGKVLLSYYRDPETVMDLVRGDLYE
ncbi:secretion system protein E [Methanomicrobiaceae archaeon CYW5]|uniref:type II/IV secretion system ATPase subunit n=1 Tax=Methanovulcanius yangii TaxID=1789227 RepID=UPI0029CA45BD|nr:type II/IV secretion system ATPase subunit [Methanovulcanius yangii]MBT8507151.1 secretion system protein E [Methanovulcanius yangii]